MFITRLRVKNFRCFSDRTFDFDENFISIEGNNGIGKTSLLEALYYACYLRSFKISGGSDIIRIGDDHCFIEVELHDETGLTSRLQIGYSPEGRVIKFNDQIIRSRKKLFEHYRVASITEDDIDLVRGAPEIRRTFLQQLLFFVYPDKSPLLTHFKKTLNQRNEVLVRAKMGIRIDIDELAVWSKQLWESSQELKELFIASLAVLEVEVNSLFKKFFSSDNLSISFSYKEKNQTDNNQAFEDFWKLWKAERLADEYHQARSLFGIHLDDFSILFLDKQARNFASRGQQKLIVFLIKVAQFYFVKQSSGIRGALLLDDFLTDFDQQRLESCIKLLCQSDLQVFVTCPLNTQHLFPKSLSLQKIPLS